MSHLLNKVFIFFALWLGLSASLQAQHYFFLEADRQQPFYIRWNGQLLSSSANGFLLVSKVETDKILLTIGFPRNQFPEINFDLRGMDRDRGFQLKDFGEKGWGLFDRTSLEVIMPINQSPATIVAAAKPGDNNFASVLADVTGDSTLLEKKALAKVPMQAPVPVAVQPPAQPKKEIVQVPDSLVTFKKEKKPIISSMVLQDSEEKKLMGYVVTGDGSLPDTIKVEIIKPLIASKPVQAESVKLPVCDRPFADIKDIRALQKKILGLNAIGDQVAAVVKAFKEKCFNSRQAMDLGWMFTDEAARLRLFESLFGLVSDPEQYKKLETAFMKEDNIKAFRKLWSKN